MHDDNQIATKGDVQNIGAKLQNLEAKMNSGFQKIHEDIDLILQVLTNTHAASKAKNQNHEKRIKRLEKVNGLLAA